MVPFFESLSKHARMGYFIAEQTLRSERFRSDLAAIVKNGVRTAVRRHRQPFVLENPYQSASTRPDFIDVKELMKQLSVEDLAATADAYFKKLSGNPDFYFAKPLCNADDTPAHLIQFSQVLAGLKPLPGMRILDFGAGTCWSSRFFTQMGYDVTACDVSPTALELGQELFRRQPVAGAHIPPKFLVFNGRHLDLPDAAFDRVVCLDALHHVPNPDQVLQELGRVLKDGGIAGFSEPGPHHSQGPQSQFEMREFKVLENDIVIEDIWRAAQAAGFSRIELAIYDLESFRVSLPEFQQLLAGDDAVCKRYVDHIRTVMGGYRLFFLYKGHPPPPDSRMRQGLAGMVAVHLQGARISPNTPIRGTATVTNSGKNLWLPVSAPFGPVNLGVHLLNSSGEVIDHDFARIVIAPETPVEPGAVITQAFELPPLPAGRYRLVFDLVAEMVTWFEGVGGQPVSVDIAVES